MTTRNRPSPGTKWLEERLSERPGHVAASLTPNLERLNRLLLLAKVTGR